MGGGGPKVKHFRQFAGASLGGVAWREGASEKKSRARRAPLTSRQAA